MKIQRVEGETLTYHEKEDVINVKNILVQQLVVILFVGWFLATVFFVCEIFCHH